MKELLIITDHSGNFLVSIDAFGQYVSMDCQMILGFFRSKGYSVKICEYSDLNLADDYNGKYILYQVSETVGGFAKSYIEDVALHLEKSGAVLLPRFEYLKAHHNKCFMEMLRYRFKDEALKTVRSSCFGSAAEAVVKIPDQFPVVVKPASGRGGDDIYLANTPAEYIAAVKRVSSVLFFLSINRMVREVLKNIVSIFNSKYRWTSVIRRNSKFVVQNYIPNLSGDYKVLIFGERYYLVYRSNRKNDFRASGSGILKFDVSEDVRNRLLDFAKKISGEIDFPIIGLDVGFDGNKFHLLEYQMVHLGPFTLQASTCWYEFNGNGWRRSDGKSNLEEVFSRSIYEYIEKADGTNEKVFP